MLTLDRLHSTGSLRGVEYVDDMVQMKENRTVVDLKVIKTSTVD